MEILQVVRFRLLSELYSLLLTLIVKGIHYHAYGFRLLSELYSLLILENMANEIYAWNGFRLLSELYSLLLVIGSSICPSCRLTVSVSSRSYILSYALIEVLNACRFLSFRLLSELYSLLRLKNILLCSLITKFPSPLGVIFSLTHKILNGLITRH